MTLTYFLARLKYGPKYLITGNKGQTTVEYLFMIAIMTVIAISVFGRLRGYLYENPDSLIGQFMSSLGGTFDGEGMQLAYKRFALLK